MNGLAQSVLDTMLASKNPPNSGALAIEIAERVANARTEEIVGYLKGSAEFLAADIIQRAYLDDQEPNVVETS